MPVVEMLVIGEGYRLAYEFFLVNYNFINAWCIRVYIIAGCDIYVQVLHW